MDPNSAHMKIHLNPTMAISLFRPSEIQDGRHFSQNQTKTVTELHMVDLSL